MSITAQRTLALWSMHGNHGPFDGRFGSDCRWSGWTHGMERLVVFVSARRAVFWLCFASQGILTVEELSRAWLPKICAIPAEWF